MTARAAKGSIRIWVLVGAVAAIGAVLAGVLMHRSQEMEAQLKAPIRAQDDVLRLKRALERYKEHTGTFPSTEQGLPALLTPPKGVVASWDGPYVEALPFDPWNAPYRYGFEPETPAAFTLYSLGADFALGGKGINADIGILSAEPSVRVQPIIVSDVPPPAVDAPLQIEDAPFHIETVPAHARVRITNIGPAYRDGMELPPGEYRVQVSASGFYTKRELVAHGRSATTHRVVLQRMPPDQAPLFVETVPPDALVTVVGNDGSVVWDSRPMRRPGVQLASGDYRVAVRAEGYDAQERLVSHGRSATTQRVVLNRTPPADAPLFVETAPPNALVKVVSGDGSLVWNSRQMRPPGVELPPGEYRVHVNAQGFSEKTEVVSHGASAVTLRVALDRIVPPEPAQPTTSPAPRTPSTAIQEHRLVDRVEPDYPRIAARRGVEGRIVLQFTISQTGRVRDIVVVEAAPRGVFDRVATAALNRWRYTPRTEDGEPVEVRGVQTQFLFQLDD